MTLQEKISNARRAAGLTQEELAQRAQLAVRTVQRIETGQSIPRMYSLRALAKALDIPYSEIDPALCNDIAVQTDQSDTVHFLRMLCLSCFSYLIIPYVHFLVALRMLRRKKELEGPALSFARSIVRTQIWWVVLFHLGLLMTLALNFALSELGDGTAVISYLWVVLGAYLVNFVAITGSFIRIKAISAFETAI